MAVRKMVSIDEDKCTGCGECVPACAEGAIQIVDGVARLMADNLCDGLGACLGDCPEGAITVEEREADDFDEEAVKEHMTKLKKEAMGAAQVSQIAAHPHAHEHGPGGGCPGARMIQFDKPAGGVTAAGSEPVAGAQPSELRQWPVQLHLVPPTAPYFKKADVLLAADCVAFSMGNFHRDHLKGRGLAVACPKLDQGQEIYLQKLIAMIDEAEINTLTVMVMEVPCCTGLVQLAREAASRANRKVPVKKTVIGLQGDVLSEEWV
ncbi:MAG: 4Fe-4S ferredoxin [Deltaproteobacteria bacterium]|nr:4Fe-4S ferredoxin [Deltaproteobacteria bacterium]